jgi:hypothetical protein
MNDPLLQPGAPKKQTGLLLGVAGCGISFSLTIVGAAAGAWIGWLTRPPVPPRTSEYSGLNELFETLFQVAGATAGGAVVGLIAGIVVSVILVRRVKARA